MSHVYLYIYYVSRHNLVISDFSGIAILIYIIMVINSVINSLLANIYYNEERVIRNYPGNFSSTIIWIHFR